MAFHHQKARRVSTEELAFEAIVNDLLKISSSDTNLTLSNLSQHKEGINPSELANYITALFKCPNPAPRNTSTFDFLPIFVKLSRTAHQPVFVGFRINYDDKKQKAHCTVVWEDTSDEALYEYESLVHCDGPCARLALAGKMTQFGDCEHNICEACMAQPISDQDVISYTGCRNSRCLSHMHALHALTARRSSILAMSVRDSYPAEMIHVKICVLRRSKSGMQRSIYDRDIPSSYSLTELKCLLQIIVKDIEHSVVCYSHRLPRSRLELYSLSLVNEGTRTLGQLAGCTDMLYLVVIGHGVQLSTTPSTCPPPFHHYECS
ncbi:hypothetical protein WR25_20871 [Diploscapter pachys]|uniref:Uncharacterized protein n=1 Tax=Diploscapter pachys TaxID=2018661 RepID=A0A2A2JPN2_9BILA|nr:hypothetical protein WR25_20871 [Diploscapter pachys]